MKRTFTTCRDSASGFSALELMVTMVIFLIATAIAVPLVQNASTSYQMKGAVNSVTGVIQATRYQAISNGFLYQIAFTNSTYQISNNTCLSPNPSCWATVGIAEPLSGSGVTIPINQPTTLVFHPSGLVQATTGATTFNLTYKGSVETITVSNYGNITVTP